MTVNSCDGNLDGGSLHAAYRPASKCGLFLAWEQLWVSETVQFDPPPCDVLSKRHVCHAISQRRSTLCEWLQTTPLHVPKRQLQFAKI